MEGHVFTGFRLLLMPLRAVDVLKQPRISVVFILVFFLTGGLYGLISSRSIYLPNALFLLGFCLFWITLFWPLFNYIAVKLGGPPALKQARWRLTHVLVAWWILEGCLLGIGQLLDATSRPLQILYTLLAVSTFLSSILLWRAILSITCRTYGFSFGRSLFIWCFIPTALTTAVFALVMGFYFVGDLLG